MARRLREREGTSLPLDHLHTSAAGAHATTGPRRRGSSLRARLAARIFPQHSRQTRRASIATIGLICAAVAVLFAGGAVFSGAGAAPGGFYDPLANTVRAVGGAPSYGPSTGMRLNDDFVGIAGTPSGHGYWVTASDGGVFTFGDAPFLGSVAGDRIAAPVVGIAATPDGRGYWLVGSDGGVFTFGDADFHGSMAGSGSPIVGIASTPSGDGYWLVGRDGGVFAFGDASFEGSATSFDHQAPLVGMAPTPSGHGYYLLGADGGVFSFGDAAFNGAIADGHHFATSIAVPRNGRGYQVASSDGSVYGFGGARSVPAGFDALAGQHPVVGLAARAGGGVWLATGFVPPAPVVAQQQPSQDAFLRCTRAHESDTAGGYRAVSSDGVYRGAYQFLRSTWNNEARAAGRPDLVGVDPAAASPADQDTIALFLFQHAGPAPWGGRCGGLQ